MEHLQNILAVLNAALEHVPPQTRALLTNAANRDADALGKILAPKQDAKPE